MPWNKGKKMTYKQKKYNFDKKEIKKHVKNDLRVSQIIKIYGCSDCAMRTFIKRNNIEYNHKIGRPKGIPHTEEHKKYMSKRLKGVNKGKKHTLETRKNMSEAHKAQIPWNKGKKMSYKQRKYNIDKQDIIKQLKKHTPMYKIAKHYGCSVSCLTNFMKRNNIKSNSCIIIANLPKNKELRRKLRMKQKFNTKMTSIEKKVHKILKKHDIKNTPQKNVLGITLVDFFVEPNICIYCDGDYWHSLKETKIRDARINKTLKENDYIVLRYTETEIHKKTEYVENDLLRVIGI